MSQWSQVFHKFGHKIEFQVSGSSAPPDAPPGQIVMHAMTPFVRFNDGKWRNGQLSQDKNIDDFETLDDLLWHIFSHRQTKVDLNNKIITSIKKELRNNKLDGLDSDTQG